jgi:hypothetical protein
MSNETWLMMATNNNETFLGETTITDSKLIYRALTKWLIRGSASKLLSGYWEYLDQYDNELEEALLDQLVSQAETKTLNPQITNVRTRDYSIDITVKSKSVSAEYKTCSITSVLWVYFHSLKQKLRIEETDLSIKLIKVNGKLDTKIDKTVVYTSTKTPSHQLKASRRVSKRSSIETR